jgi:predicted tellurium resistance membrane protein TerC
MKHLRFGTGFAIFVIFFAASLFEAFRNGRPAMVCLWLAIGIVFFIADNLLVRERPPPH